jgi:O-acetyl-ADP-ribose deacetylase (regulator of RNase III)
MIEQGHGNLLTADVEALVNTVNTVGVMGKGIALQFKRAFPANFRAYRAACSRGEIQLGRMWTFNTGLLGPRRYIINFPTKEHWRNGSELGAISMGLDALVDEIARLGVSSVAIPALGCGNGGLAWSDVRPLIEQAARRMEDVRCVIYPPEGAPPAESMPNSMRPPRISPTRALLLLAITRYLARARLQEVRDGISELEIQKLAYFLQVLGAPLRLTFVRGRYGPYAPALGRTLEAMEAHYLTGLGDRSAKVTEFVPINPVSEHTDAAERIVGADPAALRRLSALLDLVEDFETPYSLELLATVHFAARHDPPTADPGLLAERVASWSLRKARMFTPRHVQVAAARLSDSRLMPDPAGSGAGRSTA